MTPRRPRLAVAASAAFPDLRPDWPLLRQALAERELAATTQVWTDDEVRWGDFDLVVAIGAWDNIRRPAEFTAWVRRAAGAVRVVNSPDTLAWGMDKRYLAHLAGAGVATVPTAWLRPDGGANTPVPALPDGGDFVIKPTISGGGFQTARYGAGEHAAARAHIGFLRGAGHHVMVQPYQDAVDAGGEAGLVFLGGSFSHAIAKGPLLRPGAGPQEDLWRQEKITALEPTAAQLETAQGALAEAERILGPTTYARVDLVPLADGTPAVLELEVVDPALFLETRPEAASRFADVLARLVAG